MNQFFVLLGKQDILDFDNFLKSNYNAEISKILENNQSVNLWAFADGEIKKIWKDIRKNDIIFFGFENEIKCYGIIAKKDAKKYSGNMIYSNNSLKGNRKYFLFFSEIKKETEINFIQVGNRCGDINNILRKGGIHKLKFNIELLGKQISGNKDKSKKYSPKQFAWNKTPTKPVDKEKNEIFRYVRDVPLVSKLKKMYNYECQICGLAIKYGKNKFYCEVHHYYPLHEGGLDYENNMIVLCPNHHTMFDLKEMKIDFDQKTILDNNGFPIKDMEIKFLKNHIIDSTNLESQLL